MRNLIFYFFILTNFILAQVEVIKPFSLILQDGETISDEELNLNLNSAVLGQYHIFKLAVLTDDKKYIIAVTQNNTYNTQYSKIVFFDVSLKKIVYVYQNKKDDEKITYLKVIDSHLYTVNKKGFIKKWKINNESKKVSIKLLPAPFSNINFGIVKEILNNDKNIFIQYLPNKKSVQELKIMMSDLNNSKMNFISKDDNHLLKEHNISFSSSNQNYNIKDKYIISNNKDENLTLSLSNGHTLYIFPEKSKRIQSLFISRNQEALIVVKKYEIKVYDIFTNQLIASYKDNPVIESMVFTKDDNYLITATNTGYLHIWDINQSILHSIIKVHEDRVTSLDINDEGTLLVTGSSDKKIKIWDIRDINNIKKSNSHDAKDKVALVFFDKKGVSYQLASYRNGKLVKKMQNVNFNLINKENKNLENFKINNINFVKVDKEMKSLIKNNRKSKINGIDRSAQYIMYGKRNGEVSLLDRKNKKKIISLKRMNNNIAFVKISNNGKKFASADALGNIYLQQRNKEALKILKSNDNGMWFFVDKTNKIYRGDNGTFLLKSNKNNFFKYKRVGVSSSNIKIEFPKLITVENGKKSIVTIKVKNRGKNLASNIEIFLKNNDFTLFPNNSLITDKTNSTKFSIIHNNLDSKRLDYNLTFFVKVNGYELEDSYTISTVIKKPIIDIDYITINDDIFDDKKVEVHFLNNGNMNISNLTWNRSPSRIKPIFVNESSIQKIKDFENIESNKSLFLTIFNPNPPYQIWNFKNNIIYKANLEIKFESFKDGIAIININNEGKIDLNNSEIYLLDKKLEKIGDSQVENLLVGNNDISFDLTKYNLGKVKRKKAYFKIIVKQKKLSWSKNDNCKITFSTEHSKGFNIENFLWFLLLFVICVFIYWKLFWFIEKDIERILDNYEYIFQITPLQLSKTIKRLKRTGKLEEVLEKLSIDLEQVNYVVDFVDNGFTNKNIKYFSLKSKIIIHSVENMDNLYRITLEEDFSLNLQSFYLYVKRDVNRLALDIDKINEKLTIAISYTNKAQEEIVQFKEKSLQTNLLINNKLIVLTLEDVMRLLLTNNYIKALEKIFVQYIEPKYISPFNTKISQYKYRDIEKENIVFNLNKKIRSHFIIGPKGAGKTYLLELICKSLEVDNNIEIYNIEKRKSSDIIEYTQKKIKNLDSTKQLIFIVDNIDNFIKDKDIYKVVLNHFKEMNSKKNVCFIMTGFWELYQELNLKERSPLQNFAVVKTITDKLDNETAINMIISSMKKVNVTVEEMVASNIIQNSGGKINLINVICQELLETLDRTRIIKNENLKEVLKREKFLNEVRNLKNIDNIFERIVVYLMVDKEMFTSKELAIELDANGVDSTVYERESALKKLVLKDILLENNQCFTFRIPILQDLLKKEQKQLSSEIQELDNFVPIVKKINDSPFELYSVSYLSLFKIYKQLEITKVIDFVIDELKIDKESLETVKDALRIIDNAFPDRNKFNKLVAQFVERLKALYIREKDYFIIKDLKNFPLNIKEFIIYFTSEKNYGSIQNKFSNSDVVLIISIQNIEIQNEFYRKTLDKVNKFIAPKSDEIVELFLSPTPEKLLLEILSRHLSLRNISPYQVSRGIENESIFFGREKIITDITQREPRNYLIVGARRVGKSSLLKAIQRKNRENNNIESFYFTLSDTNLEGKIIEEVNLESENINNILELKKYLKQQNKKYVFLIDEADDFIEEDKNNNYKFLKILREMSEEGYVSFILAGFWQLYKSKYEHQSPLLNFGDWIEIAELEEEACYDLIIKPMRVMSIEFENKEIVQEIIVATGQKAQLISLVCQQLLDSKNKKNISSLISVEDINIALNSDAMRDELGKWIELRDKRESNKKGEFLRQIIVYGMLKNDSFTVKDVQLFLREQNIDIDLSDVEYHLELLILSFFLKKVNINLLSFRVPKQREFLQEDNIEFKLEENIYSFKRY